MTNRSPTGLLPFLFTAGLVLTTSVGGAACGPPATPYGAEAAAAAAGYGDAVSLRLVEELAIGEETGASPYLFGSVSSAWATEDRIYVVDPQVPAVRAFAADGTYLHDIGRPGQGPGEYGMPAAIAVTVDGRVAVADALGARINFYGASGDPLESWALQSPKSALDLSLSYDGELFTSSWSSEHDRMGIQAVGADGLLGEIRFPPEMPFAPPSIPAGKGLLMIVPYAPVYTWAYAPSGEMIAGVGDTYRFVIERPDGSSKTVEHTAEPAAVQEGEAAFRALLATNALRRMLPDGRLIGAEIPSHKPAFSRFVADRARRVWVVRQGPGRQDPSCSGADGEAMPPLVMAGSYVEVSAKPAFAATPGESDALEGRCWADTFLFDLFDLRTGAFSGTLAAPEEGFRGPLFADRKTVLAAVSDELGTIRVKRYRLEDVPR